MHTNTTYAHVLHATLFCSVLDVARHRLPHTAPDMLARIISRYDPPSSMADNHTGS